LVELFVEFDEAAGGGFLEFGDEDWVTIQSCVVSAA
jgi:hypothetical protein